MVLKSGPENGATKVNTLFDFLLQIIEQIVIEEFSDTDFKSITNLLQRNDTGVHALFIQHAIDC